jgi:hypothetical protein
MSDWDAARYHRRSNPQLAWGRTVAARLEPAPGERILDIGSGTGRLTVEIAATPGIVAMLRLKPPSEDPWRDRRTFATSGRARPVRR